MKIVISQPMYLPWPGLFDQIKNCDIFVHYDDATLPQGRSFISRVQIKNNGSLGWMSIPIKKSRIPINQVSIDNETSWKKKHIRRIKKSLEKSDFFEDVLELVGDLEKIEFKNIGELNIHYIEKISRFLGFKTKFKVSSDYRLKLKATDLYMRFKTWCDDTGKGKLSQTKFGRELSKMDGLVSKKPKMDGFEYSISPKTKFDFASRSQD